MVKYESAEDMMCSTGSPDIRIVHFFCTSGAVRRKLNSKAATVEHCIAIHVQSKQTPSRNSISQAKQMLPGEKKAANFSPQTKTNHLANLAPFV